MIFKPALIEKILAGRKTVTRRPAKAVLGEPPPPCRYEAGKTYAIQPGMARPSVARIRVQAVTVEELGAIDNADARAEGFDGYLVGGLAAVAISPREAFLAYWQDLYGHVFGNQLVWRIEFELVEQIASVCGCCNGKGVVELEAAS